MTGAIPAVPAGVARLADGYYNSDPVGSDNPGGFAEDGHDTNFPAALADVGAAATYAGQVFDAVSAVAADVSADATAVAGMLAGSDAVQATCQTAMTVTVGTTQPFQVPAGKAYMAGMPVRFAARPPSTLVMDGKIATYDRETGAGTFTCLRGDGLGQSAADWVVMLIGQPVTANVYGAVLAEVGTLTQWQSAFVSTPGVADVAAAKKRVVSAYESGVSAQAFGFNEPYDFASRIRYDWPATNFATAISIGGPFGSTTTVAGLSGYGTSSGGGVNYWVIDLTATVLVVVWTDSSTNRVFARHLDISSPAAPVWGNTLDTGWGGSQGLRAFRLTNNCVGLLCNDGNGTRIATLLPLGNSFTAVGSSTMDNANFSGWSWNIQAADAVAVCGVPKSDGVVRGALRMTDPGGAYVWREIHWNTGGGGSNNSGGTQVRTGSGLSDVYMTQLSSGHVILAQSGGNGLSVGLLGPDTNVANGALWVADSGADCQILGLGACAGAAAGWVCYKIYVAAMSGYRTQYRILTVSGSTISIGAAIFDPTVGTGAPSWAALLTGRYDAGPAFTYAYRAYRSIQASPIALAVSTAGVIASTTYTVPAADNHFSSARQWLIPGTNSGVITPFVGYIAILASGSWTAGYVGLYLHTAAGSARIASVNGAVATLAEANGSLQSVPNPASGAWFASALWWRGLDVKGHVAGRQVLTTNANGQLAARTWKALNGMTVTGAGTVYAAWSFDGRLSWVVLASGASRVIASCKASDHGGVDGTWYARDAANGWTAKTGAHAAIQDAMAAGINATLASVYTSAAVMTQTGFVPKWSATVDFAIVLADGNASIDYLAVSYDAYELYRPVDGASVQYRLDDPNGVQVTRVAAGSSAGLRVLVQYQQ